jgi:predicted dehydrogenase
MNEKNPIITAVEPSVSRRSFITGATASVASAAALMASGNYAHASVDDAIRIGLVGCGGRGKDAAKNCLESSDNVKIVAIADLFPDRIEEAKSEFSKLGDKFAVKQDNIFVGFDAYQKLVKVPEVNYVILATPPGFRPPMIRATVEAGKNLFTEKPVAVDAPGIRSVIESGEIAKTKGLSIVAGTQRRHQIPYLEVIKRLKDGAIGDIVGGQVYWNQGGLWHKTRESYNDASTWAIRNWLYFTGLSGDHIVEQHVHNLDVMCWVMGTHPVKAYGVGGRQARTNPEYGHIYDHFMLEYEFPNGVKIQSMCRQQEGTERWSNVSERFVGTKGTTNPGASISGENKYRFDGDSPNPYVLEHRDNIAAIRAGKPLNEARQVAESTLTAIMGRESAYTGMEITWDQMLNCNTTLLPIHGQFGPMDVPPVAIPGKTKLER